MRFSSHHWGAETPGGNLHTHPESEVVSDEPRFTGEALRLRQKCVNLYDQLWKHYIDEMFTYHAPSGEKQIEAYKNLRGKFKELAHFLYETVPNSEQRDMALHFLHTASMMANAGIAMNPHEFVDIEEVDTDGT